MNQQHLFASAVGLSLTSVTSSISSPNFKLLRIDIEVLQHSKRSEVHIDFRCHENRMYSRFGHMNNYEQTTRLRIHGDSQIRNGYSCRSLTHCSFDPERSP